MSTPELKPETPIADAATQWITAGNGKDEPYVNRKVARKLESALNAAREAIENAPHTAKCDERNNRLGFVATDPPPSCTCWKSEALAQIDKALSPQQSKTT